MRASGSESSSKLLIYTILDSVTPSTPAQSSHHNSRVVGRAADSEDEQDDDEDYVPDDVTYEEKRQLSVDINNVRCWYNCHFSSLLIFGVGNLNSCYIRYCM